MYKHKLFSTVAVLLFCIGTLFGQTPLPSDTLVFQWTVAEATGPEAVHFGSTMDLNADQTFSSKDKTVIKSQGRWRMEGNKLVLQYELLPTQSGIDSVSYFVKNGVPSMVYYLRGREVARSISNEIESQRREVNYTLAFNNGNPTLATKGTTVRLSGKNASRGPFSIMDVLRGLLGIFTALLICWLLSANRKAINWKLVGTGVLLQITIGLLVLYAPLISPMLKGVAGFFVEVLDFTRAGTQFLFGPLGVPNNPESLGVIFAFQILPVIIFFSAVTSVLYYLGILQKVVYGFAWVMNKIMPLSGAESMAAAGNVFLGQTESPLLVKPYLDKMTRSEILCLMGGGMATIAGSVFAVYVYFLGGDSEVQQQIFATQLLTASLMAAPGAIVAAKMLLPETEEVNKDLSVSKDKIGSNILDAISNGSTEGLKLAVNVGVMLLVFLAFIKGFNWFLGDIIGDFTGLNEWVSAQTGGKFPAFSLQYIFGVVFAPIAWLLGVPSEDMMLVGRLLGEKTIVNEFIAYGSLAEAKAAGDFVHYKSILISTYLLCGFANIASIGIQIGGIGALAPSQRKTLSELGVKALVVGTVAAFLTASIAGMMAGF